MVNIIEDTKKAFDTSYQMKVFALENFVRDLSIINSEHYNFVNTFKYQEEVLSNDSNIFKSIDVILLLYYSDKYDSYVNVCIYDNLLEWYWVPKELAKIETHWNTIKILFPTVLDSEENDITGLIRFAQVASKSNYINIKVDNNDAVFINGVEESLRKTLNKVNNSTIGLSADKLYNLFGQNTFNVTSLNPQEKNEILKKNEFKSVYSYLSQLNEELFITNYNSSSVPVTHQEKNNINSKYSNASFNNHNDHKSAKQERQRLIVTHPKFFWTFWILSIIFMGSYFGLGLHKEKDDSQQKLDILIISAVCCGIGYATCGDKKPPLF